MEVWSKFSSLSYRFQTPSFLLFLYAPTLQSDAPHSLTKSFVCFVLQQLIIKNSKSESKSHESKVIDSNNSNIYSLTISAPLGIRPALALAVSKIKPVVMIVPSERDAKDTVISLRASIHNWLNPG